MATFTIRDAPYSIDGFNELDCCPDLNYLFWKTFFVECGNMLSQAFPFDTLLIPHIHGPG